MTKKGKKRTDKKHDCSKKTQPKCSACGAKVKIGKPCKVCAGRERARERAEALAKKETLKKQRARERSKEGLG